MHCQCVHCKKSFNIEPYYKFVVKLPNIQDINIAKTSMNINYEWNSGIVVNGDLDSVVYICCTDWQWYIGIVLVIYIAVQKLRIQFY